MVGESLLGLSPAKQRAANTYSLGRYLFVLAVVTLGALYAAPNVFPPDPALQVKPEDPDRGLSAASLEKARTALTEAGIALKSAQLDGSSGFLRLVDDGDQLRAREVVMQALAGGEDHHIVALTRASTTPQWLADLGAVPMSLGLDLSGGVHLLLQVDMEKFVGDRMESMEETARDALVAERIRYVGRNWVDGTRLRIPFQNATLRDEAATLLAEQFEGFEISETDVDGRPALEFTMVDEYLRELEDAAISQNLQSLRKPGQ